MKRNLHHRNKNVGPVSFYHSKLTIFLKFILFLTALAIGTFFFYPSFSQVVNGQKMNLKAVNQLVTAEDILISPKKLLHRNQNSSEEKRSSFAFDAMKFLYFVEFLYFDVEAKLWKKMTISMENYQRFYEMVKFEKNVETARPEMEQLFIQDQPAKLNFLVKSESQFKSQSKLEKTLSPSKEIFQQIEFSKDYYRVSTPYHSTSSNEKNPKIEWTYFYHPNVSGETVQLFVPAHE